MWKVLAHSASSQKMHPEWASVWNAKCKEFHWKIKDFSCERCWRAAAPETSRDTGFWTHPSYEHSMSEL